MCRDLGKTMPYRFATALFLTACLAFAGATLVAVPGADAQEAGQAVRLAQFDPLSKFFRDIFGGRRLKRRQREERAPERPPAQPAAPRVEVKPKDENARVVMVFGDSIAASLARGLEEAFAEDTTVMVTGTSSANSGLVRYDHFDWQEKITSILEEPDRRIDIAVLSFGINDRQRFRTEEMRHKFRTKEWEEAYTKRISDLLDLFYQKRIPVVWVGLPPTSVAKTSADYLYLNEFYREAVENLGGYFVDIWPNFLDENERYSSRGPDVNGQRRLLRRKDGINFTRAGGRKLAFYVERQIRRMIGEGGSALLLGISTRRSGPDPRETGIGYIFDLTGPLAADQGRLAGGPDEEPFKPDEKSAYQKVMVEGSALPVVGGVALDGAEAKPGEGESEEGPGPESGEARADEAQGASAPATVVRETAARSD